MSRESRRMAGVLLIMKPAISSGGTSILNLLVRECRAAQRLGTERIATWERWSARTR